MTTCVVCDGPYADVDRFGDEFPYWVVCTADDDGEPTGKLYTCYNLETAKDLARKMAKDRRLDLVMEASAA